MSIVTKTGDSGTTALMYGKRVSKSHPRVEACGAVDELNAALGVARAAARHPFVSESLLPIQKDLVILMGELATMPEDLERYRKDGYEVVTPEMTLKLEKLANEIEGQNIAFHGWATPGTNEASAALDLARTIGRRAERRVCAMQEIRQIDNPVVLIYLNRLSDLLWLLARWVETKNLS